MDYLIYQRKELEAIYGLPHIQQIAYFAGIRPFIDFTTGIAGIRRGISYQSIREAVYVAPAPGIKSANYSREQIRRAIKSLERAGLIRIQSDDSHLILLCPLAIAPKFGQNKPDSIPTPQTNIPNSLYLLTNIEAERSKANWLDSQEADTPHYSSNNYIFLCAQFEKFWSLYPKKSGKQCTWKVFKNLQADETLLTKIFTALEQQLLAEKQQKALGLWVPHWKNAANWLAQHCWEDEINFDWIKEPSHAKNKSLNKKSSTDDWFWESCKAGADYRFDTEPTQETSHAQVIDLHHYRRGS